MQAIDTLFERRPSERLPPALVLNADHQPLSYVPLSVWGWQDVTRAVLSDTAVPVSHYDIEVRSPSTRLQLPSVIALRQYVRRSERVALSRYSLMLRDEFQCQYCGATEDLTFEHVVPQSKGGGSTWQNLTMACETCNFRKGSKSLKASGLKLRRMPYEPTRWELEKIARRYPPAHLHDDWRSALYWDIPLDE